MPTIMIDINEALLRHVVAAKSIETLLNVPGVRPLLEEAFAEDLETFEPFDNDTEGTYRLGHVPLNWTVEKLKRSRVDGDRPGQPGTGPGRWETIGFYGNWFEQACQAVLLGTVAGNWKGRREVAILILTFRKALASLRGQIVTVFRDHLEAQGHDDHSLLWHLREALELNDLIKQHAERDEEASETLSRLLARVS